MPSASRTIDTEHLTFNKQHLTKNFKSSVNGQLSTVQTKSKGFTLIELLVVIAIIGILATIAIASFTNAQAKGRDSRRISDFDALKKALELANSDSVGARYYPGCPGAANICELNATTQTSPAIAPTYIKTVPTDPKIGGGNCTIGIPEYTYCYVPFPPSCTGGTTCTSYELYACLENSKAQLGETIVDGTGTCTSLRLLYFSNP